MLAESILLATGALRAPIKRALAHFVLRVFSVVRMLNGEKNLKLAHHFASDGPYSQAAASDGKVCKLPNVCFKGSAVTAEIETIVSAV